MESGLTKNQLVQKGRTLQGLLALALVDFFREKESGRALLDHILHNSTANVLLNAVLGFREKLVVNYRAHY
jgi:hypothetical protein